MEILEEIALKEFDSWNDAVGVFWKGSTHYYEMQGIILGAVKIGYEQGLKDYNNRSVSSNKTSK